MNTDPQVVPEKFAQSRIDVVVAALWNLPRNHASRLVTERHVTVNGQAVAKSHRVFAGDQIRVALQSPEPAKPAPPLPPVVYDDADLMILDKPAGLVVHAGVGHDSGTLVDALQAAGVPLAPTADDDRPGIVHRLDKDTSGVLVIAKTTVAYDSIVNQLQQRTMHRAYIALVAGVPESARGVIDGPIGRDPKVRTRFAVVPDGKPARTRYVTRASASVPGLAPQHVSLLDLTLDTGRTHQIRVHLATVGHGIVGDDVYGVTGKLSAALQLTRPFLHAHSVTLIHPVTGVTVQAQAPLPDELHAALQHAGIGL